LRSLAVLAEWEGDTQQAIAHLQEALALAEAIGLPGEQWPILAALGELYQATGDEEGARRAKDQAADIVSRLAEKIEDERMREKWVTAVGQNTQ
jgi:Flp pilus assembly protein TadD